MEYFVQQTLVFCIPLMIVALAGVFSERSGIINIALEGIMVFGAFIGVLFVRLFLKLGFTPDTGQLLLIIVVLITMLFGGLFALLLAYASINLKADQTIGGTALNLLAPALVLFLILIKASLVAEELLSTLITLSQKELIKIPITLVPLYKSNPFL